MRLVQLLALAALVWGPLGSAEALAQTQIEAGEGNWTHRGTGVAFPPLLGGFKRDAVIEYDDTGNDGSVNYSGLTVNGGLRVTLYVYPAAPDYSCVQQMALVEAAIQRNDSAVRIGSGTAPSPAGTVADAALTARYTIPAGVMGPDIGALISDAYLYCVPGGQWLVKYRASWSGTADTMPDIGAMMAQVEWPMALQDDTAPMLYLKPAL